MFGALHNPVERYGIINVSNFNNISFFISCWAYDQVSLGQYLHTYCHVGTRLNLSSTCAIKVVPKGSIVEGYIVDELMTIYSHFLESVQAVFNRPLRNPAII